MTQLSRARVEELDIIARRYGARPSDILHGDLQDFLFDRFVAVVGMKAEADAAEKAAKRQARGRPHGPRATVSIG